MNSTMPAQRPVLQAVCFIVCLLLAAFPAQAQTLVYGTSSTVQADNTVRSVATSGTGAALLFTASQGVDRCTAVAADAMNGFIFLADADANRVWSLNVNGGSLTSINSVQPFVSGLALDTVNQKIYYTTSSTTQGNNTVQEMDYTGLNNSLLFTAGGLNANGVLRCTALAVDTANSLIFVADAGGNAIWSMNLTGGNLSQVASGLSGVPLDLAVDTANQVIYFATSSATQAANTIQRVDYNGGSGSVLFTAIGSVDHPVHRCTSLDLDLPNARIYFSDAVGNSLWSLPLSGGSPTLVLGSLPAATVKKVRLFPATMPAPKIQVFFNGTIPITNGQATPVNFGSIGQSQTGPIVAFTVTNVGEQTLDLGIPTVPPGYTLTISPPATINPQSSGTFSVQLNTNTVGVNFGNIAFTNNDINNNPFSFPITGLVTAKIISLIGNLDFGVVATNTPAQSMLTISNGGNLPLTVSNITYPSGFSGAFSGAIAGGSSQAVTVTFLPATATNYGGTVTVNSDATSGVDTIPISGFGASGNLVLTIITNGDGTVTPANLGGKTLTMNATYTVTALPDRGNVFSNWTGSIITNKNPLSFVMADSTVLQANFVTNPFLAVKGTYNGLFSTTNGVTEDTAGMLKSLTVRQNGTYSGTLFINGTGHGLSGSFNLSGLATNNILRPARQGGPLLMEMTLDWSGSPAQVIGTVSGTNNQGPWVANLTAYLATNALLPAQYTMLIPPDTNTAPANSPGGDGYALITNRAGTARITGALADGTVLSQSVPVSQGSYVPIYANLYGTKGLLLGLINLDVTNITGVSLTWIHPVTTHGLYQNGFTNVLLTNQIPLSPWTNPPGNIGLLTNLAILDTIYDTNVLSNYSVSVSPSGAIGPPPVSGSINFKTGFLKVTIGSGANKTNGYGAVLLNAANGGGYFLTTSNAQAIDLGP